MDDDREDEEETPDNTTMDDDDVVGMAEERTLRRMDRHDTKVSRERNKKMHPERGNIKMVVASVTALQKHWLILVNKEADWLALTEVRVWQRDTTPPTKLPQ